MSKLRPATVFHPSLSFRYRARLVGQAPHLEFYGRQVDLPKWTKEDGWKNEIAIKCYHFENITVNELSNINPIDAKLIITIVDPAGKEIYEWRLIGDITVIDYGSVNWGIEDVTEATLVFKPKECNLALELNKQENE